MDLNVEKGKNYVVLSFNGPFVAADITTKLRNEITDSLNKDKILNIIINMKDNPYIDSSGITIIIQLLREVQAKEGKLLLSNLSDSIKQVVKIIKFEDILPIFDSTETAIESL